MAYQNINQYNYKRWGLKFFNEITDFCLASDERDYNEDVIFSPYLIGEFDGNRMPIKMDFNSTGTTICRGCGDFDYETIVSENYWNPLDIDPNICPVVTEICDVGLTGIDNGLTKELSGLTITATTGVYTTTAETYNRYKYDRRFKAHPISGQTTPVNRLWNDNSYNYDIEWVSQGDPVGDFARLKGGFYQGFYKLAGYDYEVYPERVDYGWTVEMMIKYRWTGDTNVGLNNRYPDNKGTFFFMGARAENKFYHYASGSPLSDSGYTRVTSGLTCMKTCACINPTGKTGSSCFHVYQMSAVTNHPCGCNCACTCSKALLPETDPLYDGLSNAMSVRFSGDTGNPRVCVKEYLITGRCEPVSACTTEEHFVTGVTIHEWCSTKGIFDDCNLTPYIEQENWVQVDLVFQRDEWFDCNNLFYLGGNGQIVFNVFTATSANNSVSLVMPPITHEVSYDPAKQIEVKINDLWIQQVNFRRGNFKVYINGRLFMVIEDFEEIIPRPLNTQREKQVGVPYNLGIGGGTQGLKDNLTFSGTCPTDIHHMTYQQDPECLTTEDLTHTIYSGLTTNIYLEEIFGGSFIGDLSAFRMYTEPLDASMIKHNFRILEDKYDLLNFDCLNCLLPPAPSITPSQTPTQTPTITPTITQTPTLTSTNTPTPTLTPDALYITLDGGYSPGSINAYYVATLNRSIVSDLEVLFVDTLGTITGDSIIISGSVVVNSGTTSGTSFYSLGENYNNLNDTSTFSNINVLFTGSSSFGYVVNTSSNFDVTPTPTLTPTQTVTPTNTVTVTNTVTITPSVTPSLTPSLTPSISVTPTQTITSTNTPTISDTPTQTPTPTVTDTPSQTQTPTVTDTPTQTPTPTVTDTPSQTQTPTVTDTPTQTPTTTLATTPTITPTGDEFLINPIIIDLNEYLQVGFDEYLEFTEEITPTPSSTQTPTPTVTPTNTETPTQTPTPTISETPTNTPTITQTPTNTSTPTNTPSPSPTPALVTTGLVIQLDAYTNTSYPGTGTTVFDITSGYNHTLTGADYVVLNGIKCFDCTTGTDRVVVNGTGPTLPTSGYTYITWARLIPSTSGFRTLLYTNTTPINKITPITIPNGGSTLGYWDTSFRSSGADVSSSAGIWVQWAVVGTNSSQTFYINGSQVGSTIAFGAGGTPHWGWGNNDLSGQPWGYVANMYLYNRQLSLSEITQQYNFLAPRFVEVTPTPTPTITPTNSVTPTNTSTNTPTPSSTSNAPVISNLVLYYDPSNPSSYPGTGTTINDLSVNGLNGTMSNIIYTSPYFTYNGSSSQIAIADNVLLEPGSGDWTMEVWVNQTTSGNDVVLGKFDNGGLSQDVSYSIRTTNTTYYAQIGSGSGAGATLFVNSTNNVGTLSTWYQLVYVFKNGGTKTLETFVNGSSVGSVNHSLASILNSTNPLYIGSYNGGEFPQWFDGRIGITRLYNSALTSSQVLQNYNADKSKYGL